MAQTEELARQVIDLIAEKINNLTTLNIIVAGKTGVGKSTLINSVFRENLAETGMGRPITKHMRKIRKKDIPLNIYDTRGLELSEEVQEDIKDEISKTIENGLRSNDINQAIHCIWYCINTGSNRVEDSEIDWLRDLSADKNLRKVPIIVVLTQTISKKAAEEIKSTLLDENLDIVQIVPVLAKDFEIEGLGTVESFGLDRLIEVMGQALPDELMDTLQNVQIGSLKEKKKLAQKAIATAATAAAAEAAVPIPFADSALLIPTQIGMIASITVIFGLDVNKSIITAILSSTLGSGGATVLGRTAVSTILKFIPGAGSLAGGAISSATASVITIALGTAYTKIMEMVFRGEMSVEDLASPKGRKLMKDLFKDKLRKEADD